MYSHDPFQTYQMFGQYSPSQLPYGQAGVLYNTLNPLAQGHQSINPLLGLHNPVLGGYPQPQLFNPFAQSPLAALAWQNPLLAASLQTPGIFSAFGQPGLPQQTIPLHYSLAPQTLLGSPQLSQQGCLPTMLGGGIGQPYGQWNPQTIPGAGMGQPFGQWNPITQASLRQQSGYGISPLAGCF